MSSVLDRFIQPAPAAVVAVVAVDEGVSLETCAASEPGETSRLWWIQHPEPEGWLSHAFAPPASRADLARWYPGQAVRAEPEPDPVSGAAAPSLSPLDENGPAPPQAARASDPLPVSCDGCQHFTPSTTSPTAGLGRCRIEAPASLIPPALWPSAEHRCRDWRALRA